MLSARVFCMVMLDILAEPGPRIYQILDWGHLFLLS